MFACWESSLRSLHRLCMTGAIALFVLGVGCGTPPRVFLVEDAPSSRDVNEFVLLPMNFARSPGSGFVEGVERLDAEVLRQLTGAGFRIKRVRLSWVTEQWQESIEVVGGIASKRGTQIDEAKNIAAREELARRVLAQNQADVVVMATLMIRKGRYMGTRLKWDGVKREVMVDRSKSAPTAEVIRGYDEGTSIRIFLFDDKGRRFFERYAGLETIFRYVFNSAFYIDEFDIQREQRTDLFERPEILIEGVSTAFQPWLVIEEVSPQS
jgi:hypothetical protein